ncbi:MAG: hypothetical protein RL064_925 [Bacteroidota bacterium]
MKKFIGALVLVMTSLFVNAQDFKKVQTNLILSKYEAAKEEYEKSVVKNANLATTAEGYYWKAKIYSGLEKDASLASKYPTAYDLTKAAIVQYAALDTSFKLAKENGQEPFFDVYIKSFKDGVSAFNDKKWPDAAKNFDEAVQFSDIIFTQGWATSKQKFDTTSIIYAGYSNQNAGNIEKTVGYYKRLVDYKLNGAELLDVYKYILVQLINTKDKVSFDKYYTLSTEAYPNESWAEYKTEFVEKSLSIDEKIKLYNDLVPTNTLTEVEYQMYGDMFMAAKGQDNVTEADSEKYIALAGEAYKKAFNANNQNYAAAFNVGISYYNQYSILDDKYRDNIKNLQNLNATKASLAPKDPKKKLAFEAQFKAKQDSIKKLNVLLDAPIKEKVDGAIEWIEKAYSVLKDKQKLERSEKNVAARSVDFLATLYAYKRDKARGKDQKVSDEYDAKFNAFDKLHDKYQ